MAFGPITPWQRDRETMETVRGYFSGLKITADVDCRHEIKRRLLFGRKAMTDLDSMWPKWKGNPKKRGYMYMWADSLCCTAETDNIIKQLHSSLEHAHHSLPRTQHSTCLSTNACEWMSPRAMGMTWTAVNMKGTWPHLHLGKKTGYSQRKTRKAQPET